MLKFKFVKDVDHRGNEFSPQIEMECPFCEKTNRYYYQLAHGTCNHCSRIVPFRTQMPKRVEDRVEYHVTSETEEN